MKNGIGKGTAVLILSGFLCKLLGAFFRLPLTSILGIEGIGVFQMVTSVYSFVLILTSGGVTSALSKFVSQARARGDLGKIKQLVKTSITYCVIFGFAGGLVLFLLSREISSLQNAIAGEPAYKLMLLLIPFGGVICAMRGIFQGYENMVPTAVSQILEQAGKFLIGLLFAFLFGKRGVAEGVFGAFLGVTVSEIIAIIYLAIYLRLKTNFSYAAERVSPVPFLKAAIPLSLGNAVLPLVSALDSFVVVSRLLVAGFSSSVATALYGLQTGVVGAILNLPLIISSSLSMAILPSVSYSKATLSDGVDEQIGKALKIMLLALFPIAIGLMAICRPVYELVYPNLDTVMLDYAVKLTYFGGVNVILTALMQFFVAILLSNGKFYYCMIAYIVGGAAKFACVMGLCGLEQINIFGVAIGNIALASVVVIMALGKNRRKISVGFFDLALPLLSSVAMFLAVMMLLRSLSVSPLLQIVIGTSFGAIIYAFCTYPITKDIVKSLLAKREKKEKTAGAD